MVRSELPQLHSHHLRLEKKACVGVNNLLKMIKLLHFNGDYVLSRSVFIIHQIQKKGKETSINIFISSIYLFEDGDMRIIVIKPSP